MPAGSPSGGAGCPDSACISAFASLKISRQQATQRDVFDEPRQMFWPPRPTTSGKMIWAQMPISSISSTRATGSYAAAWLCSISHSYRPSNDASLDTVLVDDAAGAGPAEHGAVNDPGRRPSTWVTWGTRSFHRGRGAVGPQVVVLGQVRVGVDHLDLIERETHTHSPHVVRPARRRVQRTPKRANGSAGTRGRRRRGSGRATGWSPLSPG